MVIKNELEELGKIYKELEKVCLEFCFSREMEHDLCLCMDEVFSNIIKYAYDDSVEHQIEILFDYDARHKRIAITIKDDGKPFNPLEVELPDFSLDLVEREIGGLGIFLVSNIVNSIEYKRLKNINRLRLVKHLE
jgi:serine/threonine-protein kinase RsbW